MQARAFLFVCRRVIKPRMPEELDLARARRLARSLDEWIGGRFDGFEEVQIEADGLAAHRVGNRINPRYFVLYLHGGGFMLHLPSLHARLASRLCTELKAVAVIPNYRCAPESPLPAAHEDCFATYQWLLASGLDPSRIVLAGDSAGGLLAIATLQRIRDAGLPMPLCGVLFSPGCCVDSIRRMHATDTASDPLIGPGILNLLQRKVIDAVPEGDASVSPCAGSLHGLPPLLFQVGSTEMLLGQSLQGYEKARAAGTYAELQVWPRMPHVWQSVSWLPEARDALRSAADFVRRQRRSRDAEFTADRTDRAPFPATAAHSQPAQRAELTAHGPLMTESTSLSER